MSRLLPVRAHRSAGFAILLQRYLRCAVCNLSPPSINQTKMVSNGKRKLEHTNLDLEEDGLQIVTKPSSTKRVSKESVGAISRKESLSPPRIAKQKTAIVELAKNAVANPPRRIESPIRLTKVEGLPETVNIDTVSLEDILGNPLIKQCWAFNYLIDVDFLLSKFDEDVRDQVQLTVVHGFWKREDPNRAALKEAAARHVNVNEIAAYMPEMFGTHHTKMLILTRHDDLAQVVILTTNFIEQDWRMTQGAWISPLLPLLTELDDPKGSDKIGSSSRFKFDLLSYLRTYKDKLSDLVGTLKNYDFTEVKAALIASVPYGNSKQAEIADVSRTNWGWPGVKHVLSRVPCASTKPKIVVQISSVATLGVQDTWLRKSFFSALESCSSAAQTTKAEFSIVFPIAEEIRRSISGYECGSSIHMKTQSEAQQKQLRYLRPLLCQWSGDTGKNATASTNTRRAGRRRAGPHIKTYIRFTDDSMTSIDWAILTSANLSTQAWGAVANKSGEVRISSYEIGVVVWPDLFKDHPDEKIEMVPVFQKDQPDQTASEKTKVGYRMPYDLPLVSYGTTDEPWCATKKDEQPDWLGRAWPGY